MIYNNVKRVIFVVLKGYKTRFKPSVMRNIEMRKAYIIRELQEILGVSRTAIVKKIKVDEHNPVIKRYKNRFEVTEKDGQMAIMFEDWELEEEKRLSKGMTSVSNNGDNTPQNEDIIDIEPNVTKMKQNDYVEFTERYIDRFTTLQETMYNELRERDKQILLLTTSENRKQEEYLKTIAENKTLKLRNTIYKVLIGVLITVLLCVITYSITSITLNDTSQKEEIQKNPVQQEINVKPDKIKPSSNRVR